jgi:hypothetical protein
VKPLTFKKNKVKGQCAVAYCTRRTPHTLCSTHRSQKCRQSDPVRYAFNNLRNRARQRGIVFTITLEQFREWCHKVQYIGLKGRTPESYTIDRRHNDVGYHIDNIQIMTNQDNVKKYFSYDYRTKTAIMWSGAEVPAGNVEPDVF